LGTNIDHEDTALPNGTATGDDNDGIDDEDGVILPAIILADNPLNVSVQASRNGFLDAWIDYNADGDWDDPGEQVFNTQSLVTGANMLPFTPPIGLTDGLSFARFRFSAAGGLNPGSDANEGEVEDYQVTLAHPRPTLSKSFNPAIVAIGESSTLTVLINNNMVGATNLTNLGLTDVLPANVVVATPANSATTCGGTLTAATGSGTVTLVGGTLNAGAICSITVDVTSMTANAYTNIIPATNLTNDQNLPAAQNASALLTVREASLQVVKTVSNPNPVVGNTITYTYRVTNTGDIRLENVTVNDDLEGPITLNRTTLNPGQVAIGTVTYVWTATDAALGRTNIATANGTTPGGTTVNDTDSLTTPQQSADLELAKTGPAQALINTDFDFTITLSNNGPDTATNIEIADTLPAGLQFVGATPSTGTFAGGVWMVPVLNNGASATLTLTVRGIANGNQTNTAAITDLDQNDTVANNNNASATTFIAQPALQISKTSSDPSPIAGNDITYTYTIQNTGNVIITNLSVNDDLEGAITNLSPTTLNPGEVATGTVTYTWTIADTMNSRTNTATVTGNPPAGLGPPITEQSSLTLPQQIADLELEKTVGTTSVQVGSTVTFTIQLINMGPDAANGVEVIDQLPAGLTHLGNDPGIGVYDPITGIWSGITLDANNSVNLVIYARVELAGAFTNTAEITGSNQYDIDSTPANNILGEDDQSEVTIRVRMPSTPSSSSRNNPLQDFGDAIDSFRTTLANDGPRHIIVDGLRLGATVDAEPDGQPGEFAVADGEDEDGLLFPPLFPGQTAQIVITATNTRDSDAYITAWVDLNVNFQFDTSDQVIHDLLVPAGTIDGTFAVDIAIPDNLPAGESIYTRFRISTQAGLDYFGSAPDGEVEDYDPHFVFELPATGEAPWWRVPLITLMTVSSVLICLFNVNNV